MKLKHLSRESAMRKSDHVLTKPCTRSSARRDDHANSWSTERILQPGSAHSSIWDQHRVRKRALPMQEVTKNNRMWLWAISWPCWKGDGDRGCVGWGQWIFWCVIEGRHHRVHKVPGFISSRPNWVRPPPLPQASVASPPLVPGGHTRWREWGWADPIRTRGQTLWYSIGIMYNTLWDALYLSPYTPQSNSIST